ncbi:MAG: archaetidylserine decarboxylase [Gemmatimonadota bacterium]
MSHGSDEHPDPIPLRWRVALLLLSRLPQGVLSRTTGWLAERWIPRILRQPVLAAFAAATGLDPGEAEHPLVEYPSVSALFTRRLQEGARRWPEDPDLPASPVDGVVGAFGPVRGGTALQAKGRSYSLAGLLGSREEAGRFEGGGFLTIYLSPRHYHRIHSPVSGNIRWARSIPGALLPVNAPAVAGVPQLFPRNERLVAGIGGTSGEVCLVAVGAFNVGRISAAFDPGWNGGEGKGVTNREGVREPEERRYRPPLPIERGEELMAFHLGSTVVLLFGPETLEGRAFGPGVAGGSEIRVGAPLLDSLPASENPSSGI